MMPKARAMTKLLLLLSVAATLTSMAHAAEVLPDSMLLDDLLPGSTVVFVGSKAMRNETFVDSYQLSCAGHFAKSTDFKPNDRPPEFRTIPQGARLKISKNSAIDIYRPKPFHGIHFEFEANEYFTEINCHEQDDLFRKKMREVTIFDLRKNFGWSIWIEAPSKDPAQP